MSSDRPRVSICIPAFSQPALLERALTSVAAQSFRDLEVVVTDDTPDESIQSVVEKFSPHLDLHYHRNTTRLGSPENWNEAVRRSRGSLIKILHHDDWFYDANSLGHFVRLLDENRESGLAFGWTEIHDVATQGTRLHAPSPTKIERIRTNPDDLFFCNLIGAPSATIFRREQFQPFDRKMKWLVDIEFYIRFLRNSGPLILYPQPLICTTGGATHQVTSECLDIPEVEIYEWHYLYRRIDTGPLPALRRLRFLCAQFRRLGCVGFEDAVPYFREQSPARGLRLFLQLRALTKIITRRP